MTRSRRARISRTKGMESDAAGHGEDPLLLLENASLWKVALTGLALGVVHIATGPDHLSALVALASGQSWRTSFMLGVKWGCGHALGIVLVAGVCLALGRAIDFGDTVRDVLNYLIGFFLVILGGWTLYHAKVEYDLQQRPPSKWSSVQCQDATYALLSADDDTLKISTMLTSHSPAAVSKVQSSASVGVGLVHGVAGPGGVLGVLPVVSLHGSLGRAALYLVCFCLSSVVSMGTLSAIYGEVTSRSSAQSALTAFRVAAVSAAISVTVGLVWIVLQACGQLENVFGHHQ